MKHIITLTILLLGSNLLIAQELDGIKAPKKEGHNYIMTGVNWNWSPHLQVADYITEREHDIGMDLMFIRATKTNQANRFTLGLKMGANQFFGDQYVEEDTTISPLYQHDFFGLYFGIGKEWQKRVRENLVLFAGGDITFGTSRVNLIQHLVTSKRLPTYNSIEDPSNGRAYFGAIMPTAGVRYNVGRFAMSYSIVTPWQLQHTTWANVSYSQNFIRPKHAVRLGYHFFQRLKPSKELQPLPAD